jgi:hypothetical protein
MKVSLDLPHKSPCRAVKNRATMSSIAFLIAQFVLLGEQILSIVGALSREAST